MSDDTPDEKKPNEPSPIFGAYLAIGIAVGTAIGVALDNIGLGIGLGLAIGIAVGLAVDAARGVRRPGKGDDTPPEDGDPHV